MANNPYTAQSFVQPVAQANSPFNANNGNPNTVYNQKPTGMVSFIPQTGGYLAPQSDAMNNWAINPAPIGGQTIPFWQTPAGPSGPAGPRITVPPLVTDPNWVPTTPPVVAPPTTPPTGGTTPPTGNPVGHGPGGGRNILTGGSGLQLPGTSFNNYTQTGPNGNTTINWSGGARDILNSIGQSLGTNSSGGMDWQQALDLVLPGDLYNSETGRWNTGNSLVTAANAINPLLGAVVQLAVDNGWGPAALRQRIINDGLAQFDVDLRRNVDALTAQTSNIMENRTNQTMTDRANTAGNMFMPGGQGWTGLGNGAGVLGSSPFDNAYTGNILDRMNGWNTGGPVRDERSGTSTGSGVIWSAENGGSLSSFLGMDGQMQGYGLNNMIRGQQRK